MNFSRFIPIEHIIVDASTRALVKKLIIINQLIIVPISYERILNRNRLHECIAFIRNVKCYELKFNAHVISLLVFNNLKHNISLHLHSDST